jgi:hypothetical protein
MIILITLDLKNYVMKKNPFSKSLLVGLFHTREAAEEAYDDLRYAGYSEDEINVVMTNETRERLYPFETKSRDTGSELGNKAVEGMGTGATIGGVVGGIAGAIVALGSNLIIPGLGLVIIGPIAGAIAGLGAGGVAGGLIGALIGSGIPEEKAKIINRELDEGKILLSVDPHNNDDILHFSRKWEEEQDAEVYL